MTKFKEIFVNRKLQPLPLYAAHLEERLKCYSHI